MWPPRSRAELGGEQGAAVARRDEYVVLFVSLHNYFIIIILFIIKRRDAYTLRRWTTASHSKRSAALRAPRSEFGAQSFAHVMARSPLPLTASEGQRRHRRDDGWAHGAL